MRGRERERGGGREGGRGKRPSHAYHGDLGA